MAAPAPLPLSFEDQFIKPNSTVPVPPKLSDKLVNIDKADRYFVHEKQNCHGKQWIASCLEKAGLTSIDCGFLPHPKCVFYWIQKEYAFFDHQIFSKKEVKPCISFIPSQSVLGDKTKFARTLYEYYGDDAWKITPQTLDCSYDDINNKWIVSKDIQRLIESKSSNHVWITKSSFGSLGSGVFLYRGNTLKSFEDFIHTKYKPQNWGNTIKKKGYLNTSHIDIRSIIVQQYIDKPLLYNNQYKFDLRVYALTATTNPSVLFFHIGKMRVCGVEYTDFSKMNDDMKEDVLYGHLSNSKIQRSHNNYDHTSSSIDGQTMLNDWDAFVRFMYDIAVNKKQFNREWFERYQYEIESMTLSNMKDLINTKCCRLFGELYSASKHILDNDSVKYDRECQFMFQGNDIIIDSDGKFYLLEVNRCPSLSLIGYQSIKDMTRNMLKEAINICLEIRELKLKNVRVDQDTHLKSVNYWIKCKLDYKKPVVDRVNDMIHSLDKLLDNKR